MCEREPRIGDVWKRNDFEAAILEASEREIKFCSLNAPLKERESWTLRWPPNVFLHCFEFVRHADE